MNAQTFATFTIPSPREALEQTTPVAEVVRQRLATAASTDELRRRLLGSE